MCDFGGSVIDDSLELAGYAAMYQKPCPDLATRSTVKDKFIALETVIYENIRWSATIPRYVEQGHHQALPK